MSIFHNKLFVLDINEFYNCTLEDSSKSVQVKTLETCQLAEKWENVSPHVPSDKVDRAKRTLEDKVSHPEIAQLLIGTVFHFVLLFLRLSILLIMEER